MAKNAAEFLVSLSRDPKLRALFKQDPDAATAGHGLSAADKDVLTSADPMRIGQHLGEDSPVGCLMLVFVKGGGVEQRP